MTVYEWDVEEVDGSISSYDEDCEIISHNHHESAKDMMTTLSQSKNTDQVHYRPCVVRDIFDKHEELKCRSWAYLFKDGDAWKLPKFFVDGMDRKVIEVPKKLVKELENSLTS